MVLICTVWKCCKQYSTVSYFGKNQNRLHYATNTSLLLDDLESIVSSLSYLDSNKYILSLTMCLSLIYTQNYPLLMMQSSGIFERSEFQGPSLYLNFTIKWNMNYKIMWRFPCYTCLLLYIMISLKNKTSPLISTQLPWHAFIHISLTWQLTCLEHTAVYP